MNFFAYLLRHRKLSLLVLLTLASLLALPFSGCSTTTAPSTYRAASLRISSVPNALAAQLAALDAPRIDQEINRAFIADGRFASGTELFLSVELTGFQEPRSVGAQELPNKLGTHFSFLAGIMVVSTRWYDAKQNKLEEVQFEQDIIPNPGELNDRPALTRAVRDVAQRIMVYTTSKYLAKK